MLTEEAKLKINKWFMFYPLTDQVAEKCEEIWDKAGKALAEAILDEENQCIDEQICEMEQAIYRNCRGFSLGQIGQPSKPYLVVNEDSCKKGCPICPVSWSSPDCIERDYALQNLDDVREGFFSRLESGGADATVCLLRFGVLMPANASIVRSE
jgi:hypothetical protein